MADVVKSSKKGEMAGWVIPTIVIAVIVIGGLIYWYSPKVKAERVKKAAEKKAKEDAAKTNPATGASTTPKGLVDAPLVGTKMMYNN